MNILLAVDGSVYTKRMLAYLGTHQELFGPNARHTAITVVAPVPPNVTHFIDSEALDAYYEDEAQKVLKTVQAFARQLEWVVTATHRIGHAADVIAKTATTGKFDLLMMGSHGHSGLKGLLLGSVTSRVLARCATPTLIIR